LLQTLFPAQVIIMGNNREQLKANLGADLRLKIQGAQEAVQSLKAAQDSLETNSAKVR
jgi:hypothetical protein